MHEHVVPCAKTRQRTICAALGYFAATASIAAAITAFPAQAQTPAQACNPAPQALASSDPSQLHNLLQQELRKLPECQHDSAWLAWAGWALNQTKHYSQATEYLERSLLLDPWQLRVQLDYAIALAGSGDGLAAIQLMQVLLQEPQLPPLLRTSLAQEIAYWSAATAGPQGWQHRWQAVTKIGHDSNLLGTPDLTTLTITTAGQNIQLPLDASYTRQPGNYARTDLSWSAHKDAWNLFVSAGGRASRRAGAGLQQIQAAAERQGHTHYISASAALFNSSAGTRFRSAGLAAGLHLLKNNCTTRAGVELQQRSLQNNTILSGQYSGLALQQTCEAAPGTAWPLGLQAWQASLRWGQDRPEHIQRPGAAQRQTLARLLALGQGWAPRHQWLLDAEAYLQADTQGYSPLLQNNAQRRIRRWALRAEYSWPLHTDRALASAASPASAWQLAIGLEWQRQRSNLSLFQQRSQGAYLALRTQW